MACEIPLDTIRRLQISLRKAANVPSYDPTDASLPDLPSLEDSISRLDPSPPYLRCKHCKGRLLRGINSLFCVFCGREQWTGDPPDPINFRSTTGYKWLLESLKLDGSELVELFSEANESSRGQNIPKNEMPLSDLLNLEIGWHAKSEQAGATATEAPSWPKRPLNLGGVDLDDFFVEAKTAVSLRESEEQLGDSHRIESNTSQGHQDLSLFESAQPSSTSVPSFDHETEDSQSLWNAEFQSAGLAAVDKDSKLFDPFAGSSADISMQMDMVFGSGKESTDTKTKDSSLSSYSNTDDWFQDEPRSTANSGISGQSKQSNMIGSDSRIVETTNSSSTNMDWFEDDQWQNPSKNSHQSKIADENDDTLDAWDDFTSSASVKNQSNNNSWNDPTDHGMLLGQNSEMDLFSMSSNSREKDAGGFQQPDLFSGESNNQLNPLGTNLMQSEASDLDRMVGLDETIWSQSEAGKGQSMSHVTSPKTDMEMIISQMHDLSFMLDSNLSIPQQSQRPNVSTD